MANLIIKKSSIAPQGLFTTIPIDKDVVIMKVDGVKVLKANIDDFSGEKASRLLQIGTDLYLDMKETNQFFINHSCNPNCGIRILANTAFLISIMPIAAESELTFDYSTTSDETTDTWSMKCGCGQYGCRKTITGAGSLPDDVRTRYQKLGVLAKYV